ncbi:hypothetical protein PHMEG_0005071 [Phytophthora megakarya]|uniref:Uncharacterized protein n=1 Tax=Phytophthora megakarya TaxID=4795 RepID=A0A225WSE7_9STRA|nr:hypothetical protein PHMEG_0005071 [Phytophthora megakarya]
METPCLSGLREQKLKSQKTSVPIHQKKSRIRKASSSSTSLQRKKQAETRMLREEAIKLHGYVKQLKRMRRLSKRHGDEGKSSFVDMKSSGSDSLMWHQRATSAYDKRHLSEQTNRRLKEILSNQERTYNTLNDIFKRRDLFDVRNGCGVCPTTNTDWCYRCF